MSETLPAHASVVVIGGGIMGCSTLYHLAGLGLTDAILLERNRLTSGTTWHSAAQVRALRSTRNMTDLIRYSIDLYSRLEQETGQAVGWINKGSLSIATTPDRLTHIRRQAALARLFDVEAATIPVGEARERWPLMNADDVIGAVWSPGDGRVSPSDLCAALVKGATARGAGIHENTAVTGIETRAGRVRGVVTAAGTIRCDAVAVCTGLWSRAVAAAAGAAVPLYPCEHFYLLTEPVAGLSSSTLPTLSDHDAHLYIRDDSGGLLVGCFEPMGKPIAPETLGDDFAFQLLPEDWDHFEPMMHNALHRLPGLADAGVKMLLNGPESFTPDGSFLLGETAETRGLFLGCGMNSVGVATGGGAGMALARCIRDGRPPMDLHEVDPTRFPDCFNSAAALAARVPEVLGRHYEISHPHRQWTTARGLRPTPLHADWVAAGAHFGQVGGWERPLFFGKTAEPVPTFGKPDWFDRVGAEVRQAHGAAALFDLSTFGQIEVTGADAERLLQRVCCNRMDRPAGRVIYTAMLTPAGGIASDLTAVRLADDRYRLSVGTMAVRRDLAWLRRHADGLAVTLTDRTGELAVLGLMGPQAAAVARRAGADGLAELGYFRAGAARIAGRPVTAARLSYVGEFGWEITAAVADIVAIHAALTAAGARPAGMLAQTSMRIEKRFLAHGHDMDTDVTPLQVGLAFAVGWETGFIGREALLARRGAGAENRGAENRGAENRGAENRGAENRIVTLLFEPDETVVPLGNEPVWLGDRVVGKTTSAAWGYRIGRPLALADLGEPAARADGTPVTVDLGGVRQPARVTVGPAFDPDGSRMRQPPR